MSSCVVDKQIFPKFGWMIIMKMIANFIVYVLLSVQLFAQETDKTIVISDDLKIIRLSENALIHDSMMQVEGWGNVSVCMWVLNLHRPNK